MKLSKNFEPSLYLLYVGKRTESEKKQHYKSIVQAQKEFIRQSFQKQDLQLQSPQNYRNASVQLNHTYKPSKHKVNANRPQHSFEYINNLYNQLSDNADNDQSGLYDKERFDTFDTPRSQTILKLKKERPKLANMTTTYTPILQEQQVRYPQSNKNSYRTNPIKRRNKRNIPQSMRSSFKDEDLLDLFGIQISNLKVKTPKPKIKSKFQKKRKMLKEFSDATPFGYRGHLRNSSDSEHQTPW